MHPNLVEPTPRTLLQEAAEACGIEPAFWDIWAVKHIAPPDVLRAILGSLGVDATSDESITRAMEQREWEESSRLLAPTLVIGSREPAIAVSLPFDLAQNTADFRIELESGESARFHVALADCKTISDRVLRGQRFVRKLVRIAPADKAGAMCYGYHRITVTVGGVTASARLIVCPERTYSPEWLATGRAAGLTISLYGVRSNRNWGCGDFTDLENLIDWVANDVGVGFIGLNPLHSIPNRQPYNTSPYLPDSSFYRNFIYLDVRANPGVRLLRAGAQTGWMQPRPPGACATQGGPAGRI